MTLGQVNTVDGYWWYCLGFHLNTNHAYIAMPIFNDTSRLAIKVNNSEWVIIK